MSLTADAITDAADMTGVPVTSVGLYLSAGVDSRPFIFLQRAYLDARGVPEAPAPNLFIYIDANEDRPIPPDSEVFDDGRTTVHVEAAQAGTLGVVSRVQVKSDRPEFTRAFTVIGVSARNEEVLPRIARDGWYPDVVVAVKDGCAFGGNGNRCENRLRSGSATALDFVERGTRWWVSDHFQGHRELEHIEDGDVIAPKDPSVPVHFVRRAMLSREWGHDWEPWHGAALFEAHPGTARR